MDCGGFGVCGTFWVLSCFPRSKRERFGYCFDFGVGDEGDAGLGWAVWSGAIGKKRRREGGIMMAMGYNAMKLLFYCLRARHSLRFGGEASFVEWGDLGTV
jgi:hypothetical protein